MSPATTASPTVADRNPRRLQAARESFRFHQSDARWVDCCRRMSDFYATSSERVAWWTPPHGHGRAAAHAVERERFR